MVVVVGVAFDVRVDVDKSGEAVSSGVVVVGVVLSSSEVLKVAAVVSVVVEDSGASVVGVEVSSAKAVVGAVLGDDGRVMAGVLDALVSNSKNDSCSVELSCDS